MSGLIAYIPTLNSRHLKWFEEHVGSDLFLIGQAEAEILLPRLARNLAALPTEIVSRLIEEVGPLNAVRVFDPQSDLSRLTRGSSWVLPDEDVSHLFAERYLLPLGCDVQFEMIWARWDMNAVYRDQPVIPDVEISHDAMDIALLDEAERFSDKSPDWWRRVGAMIVSADGQIRVLTCNTHMPNEYETYILGDPAVNRDAGQAGKSCVLHAELFGIALCAKEGFALDGGKIYVSTFPCEGCARAIAASGIRTVIFREGYSSLNALEVLRAHEVKIVQAKDSSGLP